MHDQLRPLTTGEVCTAQALTGLPPRPLGREQLSTVTAVGSEAPCAGGSLMTEVVDDADRRG